jgi:flavin-dependent dehydrogenase
MIKENYSTQARGSLQVKYKADLAIVGGGMAGVCSAITAARAGIKVVLIQDRPDSGRKCIKRGPSLDPRCHFSHGQ